MSFIRFFLFFISLIVLSFSSHSSSAFAELLIEEKNWRIRSTGKLRISFPFNGNIKIRGWSQEQIYARLSASKRIKDKIKKDSLTMLFYSRAHFMEFFIRHASELSSVMQTENLFLELRVPMNTELELWSKSADVLLQNITQKVTLRGASGNWEIRNISSPMLQAYCEKCAFHVLDSQGSLRYITKTGSILVENYNGKNIFLSNHYGDIQIKNSQGTHSLVSKTGQINGDKLRGSIDFQTLTGLVFLRQIEGEVSGRTKSGKIQVHTLAWRGKSEVGLETEEGDIHLSLPPQFDGWLEATSKEGQVFQNKNIQAVSFFEKILFGKKRAYIKLSSLKGNIAIERR